MKYSFQEHMPDVHDSAYMAPTAVVIGRVKMGENSSIWFNSIARGDINTVTIGSNTNIQDLCTLHVTHENGVAVGDRVTIGHGAVLHGCKVEDDCLIGMGSVVLDGASIGKGSIVAAGAVVAPNTVIPPDSLVMGVPGRVMRRLHEREQQNFAKNWQGYVQYSKKYADPNIFKLLEPAGVAAE
jgi:Carbonic anhydrases/acetyltransferases, isoleucine patch superfamily